MSRSLTHPTAPLSAAALDAITRLEYALAAYPRDTTAKVAKALGFNKGWTPREHLGETPTRLVAWDQHELNAIYQRAGGTVTTRTVERSTSDEMIWWTATEITLAVEVPGIGTVRVSTDWEECSGGRDLPLLHAVSGGGLFPSTLFSS